MKLSIVATVYNSARHLKEFHSRASAVAREIAGGDYEIVLVNDGSSDHTLPMAVDVSQADEHVTVLDLSRNFGHHRAMMAGLAEARGDIVFLLDSDLEEEPEWLKSFYTQMQTEQCDVVYGVQARRRGSLWERWSGNTFYRIFRLLTGFGLPQNIVTARLMTRRYVDALLLHREREVMILGLWVITGFDQRPQKVTKHRMSPTTYTFAHKISLLVDSITSFSNVPLIGIFYAGVGISFLAVTYIGYLLWHWFFFEPLSGWTSVVASIWLLGGLMICFIGVLGIYLSKIFLETKQRPNVIVRQVYTKRRVPN